METANRDHEPRHPIGVVSGRTGLPQDVLRAWERRYGVVTPHRTKTGRRLYTDGDLRKLLFLRRAVESGRRISDVAPLTIEELEQLVQEDRSSRQAVPKAAPPDPASRAPQSAGAYVERSLEAIRDLDAAALRSTLADASLLLSAPVLRREVLDPLLHEIGDRWRDGSLRIANEHLATAVLRSFLGGVRGAERVPAGAPCVVVTTPTGQRHELGALLAATVAIEIGWDVLYLGPSLPAVEIAAAARSKNARAIGLSIVSPADDPLLADELRELRRHVGDLPVFVGGVAAEAYASVLEEIGARRIEDVDEFQRELEALPG